MQINYIDKTVFKFKCVW